MSDMSDPINFPQEDVDVLFEKAKKLWIFLGSTKEDLLSTLTSTEKNRSISETLDFSSYPASVVQRIWNRPKGLSKLLDIKIIDSDPEKGNTIEVGGKRISIYMPEADGKEVFKCPKKFGFQNVRYIKWKAIDSELEKADKKLFDTMVDFDEFIKKISHELLGILNILILLSFFDSENQVLAHPVASGLIWESLDLFELRVLWKKLKKKT